MASRKEIALGMITSSAKTLHIDPPMSVEKIRTVTNGRSKVEFNMSGAIRVSTARNGMQLDLDPGVRNLEQSLYLHFPLLRV